jgi:hypothetical protein
MKYSPIALFIYNRPEHTKRMLASLMKCPEFLHSPVYVFCDGPKTSEDEPIVQATRTLARKMIEHHAKFEMSEQNRGPDRSIIEGVSRLCQSHGRVIVFEDDLVVAPNVLHFFNAALERYEQERRVMQISGFIFPLPTLATLKEAFFLPFTTSWGWATWQRSWDVFDPEAMGWEAMKKDSEMHRRFNLDGAYDYYSMLSLQMAQKRSTWDVCWYWSVFKTKGIVLYPPTSHVVNTGFDGSGTHGWRSGQYLVGDELTTLPEEIGLPALPIVHESAYKEIKNMLMRVNRNPLNRLRGLIMQCRQKMYVS